MIFISLAETELFCIMTVINHTKGDFFIHMMHLSTGAWGFIWVLIVQLVLAIGIAWIIVQWVKFFSREQETGAPLDIAKERYASGEITKDELEEIKRNLE